MNTIEISHITVPAAAGKKSGTEILVFKTNLTDTRRIHDIEPMLDVHPDIIQWNVDLNDCDNVLRIVSRNVAAQEIETMLLGAGYYCEELQ
jgi:hypothetical protein